MKITIKAHLGGEPNVELEFQGREETEFLQTYNFRSFIEALNEWALPTPRCIHNRMVTSDCKECQNTIKLFKEDPQANPLPERTGITTDGKHVLSNF